jgi:ribosomal protein L11 methyltransferase
MFRLTVECRAAERDGLVAELSDSGTGGIVEHDLFEGGCRLEAFFEDKAAAAAVAGRISASNVTVEACEDRDWVAYSQAQWEPELVGERFFLVPSWRNDPTPAGRLRLMMPPGSAPGTGFHPATQLALEALERRVRSGRRVFDLGTGSGILALGAVLLGADRVIACDIETAAVEAAASYLREAGAPVSLFAGSARSVGSGAVDLLVANLNAAAIRQLAGEMARVLATGGEVIVTGFERYEAERVEHLFVGFGFACRDRIESSGWVCLICGRS